jgi:hypothetical protein
LNSGAFTTIKEYIEKDTVEEGVKILSKRPAF